MEFEKKGRLPAKSQKHSIIVLAFPSLNEQHYGYFQKLISEQFWENPKILYNHSFLGIFIPPFYKSFLPFFEDLLFSHRPSKEKSISIIYKCMTSSYIYTNSTNIIYDKRRAYHTNFSIAWTFRKIFPYKNFSFHLLVVTFPFLTSFPILSIFLYHFLCSPLWWSPIPL